jgi:hypothetical protein
VTQAIDGNPTGGVTRCPLITTIGLGSACQGTPLIHPCRLDDGIHAVDTPDKHHPDPDYALNGLHPPTGTTIEGQWMEAYEFIRWRLSRPKYQG